MKQETNDETRVRLHQETTAGISYIERAGSGHVVVFLHGIGSNAHSFEPLFAHLPADLRLIAWNAPGYLSSVQLDASTPRALDYALALKRLFNAIGLERAHIVGHSLGTLIAAAFAEHAPDRVASLTLAASAQGYRIGDERRSTSTVAKRLDDLNALGPKEFAKTRAPRLVFRPDEHPRVVERVQSEMARICPESYAKAVQMLISGDLGASVSKLRNRIGFIVGSEDQITPIKQTKATADAYAAIRGHEPRIVSIPNAGHAVYVQAPRAFADALSLLVPELKDQTPTCAEGEGVVYGR